MSRSPKREPMTYESRWTSNMTPDPWPEPADTEPVEAAELTEPPES